MLGKNSDKALDTAEDNAVYHDRTVTLVVLTDICQVEALGHLEVELNGAALPRSADGILEVKVDLRTVECAVALVDGVGLTVLLERAAKCCGSGLPLLVGPMESSGRVESSRLYLKPNTL